MIIMFVTWLQWKRPLTVEVYNDDDELKLWKALLTYTIISSPFSFMIFLDACDAQACFIIPLAN